MNRTVRDILSDKRQELVEDLEDQEKTLRDRQRQAAEFEKRIQRLREEIAAIDEALKHFTYTERSQIAEEDNS